MGLFNKIFAWTVFGCVGLSSAEPSPEGSNGRERLEQGAVSFSEISQKLSADVGEDGCYLSTGIGSSQYTVAMFVAPGAQECRFACQMNHNCTHFTYSLTGNVCYLKSGAAIERAVGGDFTGLPSCDSTCYLNGVTFWSADDATAPLTTSGPTLCHLQCNQTSGCSVWTWIPESKKCYLKRGPNSNSFRQDENFPNAISGPKFPCELAQSLLYEGGMFDQPWSRERILTSLPNSTSSDLENSCSSPLETGSDASGFQAVKVGSIAECRSACRGLPQCTHIVYFPKSQLCEIKVGQPRHNVTYNAVVASRSCDISCFRTGIDFGGNTIGEIGAPRVTDCQSYCYSRDDCKVFIYDTQKKKCYLKSYGFSLNLGPGPNLIVGPREPCNEGGDLYESVRKDRAILVEAVPPHLSIYPLSKDDCLTHEDGSAEAGCDSSCFSVSFTYASPDITELPATSAFECRGQCEANDECLVFVFDPPAGKCHLKGLGFSWSKTVLPNGGLITGPKKACSSGVILKDVEEHDRQVTLRGQVLEAYLNSDNTAPGYKCLKRNFGSRCKNQKVVSNLTLEQCLDQCRKESKCNHITYNTASKNCHLKFGLLELYTYPNDITGSPYCDIGCFERSVNYRGEVELMSRIVNVPNDCQALCQGHPECVYWVYWSHEKKCFLKPGTRMLQQKVIGDDYRIISGPKYPCIKGDTLAKLEQQYSS